MRQEEKGPFGFHINGLYSFKVYIIELEKEDNNGTESTP
jgi:hypothetical protein